MYHRAYEGYYSFLRYFSFSFQHTNSSKMSEETLFLSRKAVIPEGMLPHRHFSVTSPDEFQIALHWGTRCLPQALPWQGRSSAWLSESQPIQIPQENQDLAPNPNRALLTKIYALQLHLKLSYLFLYQWSNLCLTSLSAPHGALLC